MVSGGWFSPGARRGGGSPHLSTRSLETARRLLTLSDLESETDSVNFSR